MRSYIYYGWSHYGKRKSFRVGTRAGTVWLFQNT